MNILSFPKSVAVFAFASCICASAFASPPSLNLISPAVVPVQGVFSVDLDVAQVVDLGAFQFDVNFDPSVFSLTSITEGTFLSGGGTTFFDGGSIDNAIGRVSFAFDTLIGNVAGVNGSGTLAVLNFAASTFGAGAIGVSNVTLLDSLGNAIAINAPSIQVSAVPEPSMTLMLLIGIAALSAYKLRGPGRKSDSA